MHDCGWRRRHHHKDIIYFSERHLLLCPDIAKCSLFRVIVCFVRGGDLVTGGSLGVPRSDKTSSATDVITHVLVRTPFREFLENASDLTSFDRGGNIDKRVLAIVEIDVLVDRS